MLRWIFFGIVLAAAIVGFAWWRRGAVQELLPEPALLPVSTPELPPVTASREKLLKFEEEIIALKAKRLSALLPTSTTSQSVIAAPFPEIPPGSQTAHKPSSSSPLPAPPSPPASSPPAATTTLTRTPAAAPAPERQRFLIDGVGFCENKQGASLMLSGYPLAADATALPTDIIEWTTTRVRFFAPTSVPPGIYTVTIRGVNQWGYCTTATSSPRMITIK